MWEVWAAAKIGDIVFYGRTLIGGGVAEVGFRILPWQREKCAIAGNMGMVGVRYDGTMEMVAVGGYAAEIQDYKGSQREE